MQIKFITEEDEMWNTLIDFAGNCSWRAGAYLAKDMLERKFTDWERVVIAQENNKIAGYCTLTKSDCIPNVSYTPYIGYMFVDEKFRGNRLSEKLILSTLEYAKSIGFDNVYLVSDHINLYEKYGFVKIDEKPDYSGSMEKIYIHKT